MTLDGTLENMLAYFELMKATSTPAMIAYEVHRLEKSNILSMSMFNDPNPFKGRMGEIVRDNPAVFSLEAIDLLAEYTKRDDPEAWILRQIENQVHELLESRLVPISSRFKLTVNPKDEQLFLRILRPRPRKPTETPRPSLFELAKDPRVLAGQWCISPI